jgi:hypothetical protein
MGPKKTHRPRTEIITPVELESVARPENQRQLLSYCDCVYRSVEGDSNSVEERLRWRLRTTPLG